MTPAERAAASRQAQALPPTISDPATLQRIAVLVRHTSTSSPRGEAA